MYMISNMANQPNTQKTDSEIVGENIRELREQRGWLLADVASATERLGEARHMTESTISRIETQNLRGNSSRQVRVEELQTFAAIFGVDASDLLRDKGDLQAEEFERARVHYGETFHAYFEAMTQWSDARYALHAIAGGREDLGWWIEALEFYGPEAQQPDGPLWVESEVTGEKKMNLKDPNEKNGKTTKKAVK